jgi:transcriptional regulator with XRE-family HTH domain
VPYKLVHNWERGNNLPNVNYIIRLAEHFGVSTDYLLGVSDDGRQRRRAAATSADAAGATLEVLEAAEQLHPPTESTRSPARKPRT